MNAITAEDLGNIVALEHVNLAVSDQAAAVNFYLIGMGFTRDPHLVVGPDNMWINVGRQQLHLPLRRAQVLPGHIGIVVRDLAALERRLEAVAPQLAGTRFAFSREGDYLRSVSPSGNELRCYAPGRFGSMSLGMPYVEFQARPGTARGIARFYEQVLGAPAHTDATGASPITRVDAGNAQSLIFRETSDPIRDDGGHHIAIYVNRVSEPYAFLQSRGLIAEGMLHHQFRFKDIVDPDTGEKLAQLEHEVRSMRHPMYLRPLVNRDPELTFANYSRRAG